MIIKQGKKIKYIIKSKNTKKYYIKQNNLKTNFFVKKYKYLQSYLKFILI